MRRTAFLLAGMLTVSLSVSSWSAQPDVDSENVDTSRGDEWVDTYFRDQTRELTNQAFAEIRTLEDWTSRRDEYRRQLLEMLGLDPLPERTPLHVEITGSVEQDGVIAEQIHFQSSPGLYVTANLYRPAKQNGPLPAILYVCGHGGVKRDGVSLGNKVHYQHHGAWFARNGYVCLTIDTIQLGEIEGIHHGTYREKMWWWNNRGYSPAGVEAWNCLRSLDYLQSRDEVDPDRLGVTGRSGGGAYSWWIAAIDDRIKVAVPVAGITSLHNHVVDGCVEGHCDCMYMVNTYRWDYPMVAALVAPRPLLISNSDKDGIFPLDGVVDVHTKVKRIYDLYGAADKLGLQITEGPHKDTQELRVHAFRWFNRFLHQKEDLVRTVATPFFEPHDLRVFSKLPKDQRVTTIHESFVPVVGVDSLPQTREEVTSTAEKWIPAIQEKCFGGWPTKPGDLDVKVAGKVEQDDTTLRWIDFTSQQPYRLRMPVLAGKNASADRLIVRVLDQTSWESVASGLACVAPDQFPHIQPDQDAWRRLVADARDQAIAYVVPRGVGPTEWSRDARTRTHIRRRFMQLGQTAAGMQIYDVHRALLAIDQVPALHDRQTELRGQGHAATWSLFAAAFTDDIDTLQLVDLPTRNRDAPDLLNVSRIVEVPQMVLLAASRGQSVTLVNDPDSQEAWGKLLAGNKLARQQITIQPYSEESPND